MKINYVVPLVFISLGIKMSVFAQNDSTQLYQLSIDELLKPKDNLLTATVSSATKFEQSVLDAPSIVTIIPQRTINTYGWISLNDILYRQPGFVPSKDYDRSTVSSRGVFEGWNNNHLLLLIDGVPCNDNLYGTAYTTELMPLVFAQSVEIVRGPVSALYGANAMNGALSLNTISPVDFRQSGMMQMRIGSKNTQIYDVVVGGRSDMVEATIAFNAYSTNGNEYFSYDDSERSDASGNLLQHKVNDRRSSYYLFGKLVGQGSLQGLEIQYHQHEWTFETGHGWLFIVPDQPESMIENRRIVSLRYNTAHQNKRLIQEYVLRYQKHSINWDMRYYPNGALDNFYPFGVTEYLNTDAEDVFGRIQYTYNTQNKGVLLVGFEGNIFYYDGDNAHTSNVDLNTDFSPFANNDPRPMRAWLEFIKDRPVFNAAFFGQYTSPRLINGKLQATMTLRYDNQFFTYRDIYDIERSEVDKSFEQINPRLGLVFHVLPKLTLKALGGRAFRTPTPTEMFGANTYSLASNITQLSAESVTTYELVGEWQASAKVNARINTYYTDFDDIIAYSVANANLSTNLYSLTSVGFETEVQALFGKRLSLTTNYSYVHRLNETIRDSTIAESPNVLTWYPAHSLNVGLAYEKKRFFASAMLHAQNQVQRRTSDRTDKTQGFRPNNVAAWLSLDTKLGYRFTPYLELGLLITNLSDQKRFLIKNNSYRFDYLMRRREFLLNLKYDF